MKFIRDKGIPLLGIQSVGFQSLGIQLPCLFYSNLGLGTISWHGVFVYRIWVHPSLVFEGTGYDANELVLTLNYDKLAPLPH